MKLTDKKYSSSWIIIPDDTNESDLIRRILVRDIIISDLDQTDAFPAKEVVVNFLRTGNHATDRGLWNWLIAAAYLFYDQGTKAYNDVAASFINTFLKNPREQERLAKKYTSTHA